MSEYLALDDALTLIGIAGNPDYDHVPDEEIKAMLSAETDSDFFEIAIYCASIIGGLAAVISPDDPPAVLRQLAVDRDRFENVLRDGRNTN